MTVNHRLAPAGARRPVPGGRLRDGRWRGGRCRGGRLRGEAGYSVVEVAITFPVLLLLVMLVVQFALLWHARHVAEAAAQAGLRSARGYTSTAELGQSDARSYLTQVAPRLLVAPTVDVRRTPTTVTVRVHAGVLSIVPLGLGVDETAVGPVERYVGPG